MKILILITGVLLISCNKSWDCDITTVTESEYYDGTSVHSVEFEGTKDEMKDFEESGTKTMSIVGGTITQTTECK